MTATIIKSGNIAKNNLGSILPELISKDGLKAFLDFSNGKYTINNNSVKPTDFIKLTRNSTAIGLNKDGNEVLYGVGEMRFHQVLSKKMYGLAFGDVMRNHFLNSTTPVTQTITIEEGTEKKYFLYVQVIGNGSVAITGAVSGVATQDKPLMLKISTPTATITATVSGQLSYVQVSKVTSPYGIDISRPTTTSTPSQKTQELTQVERTVFDTLNGTNGEITVFMKMVRFDGGDLTLTPQGGTNKLMLFDAAVTSAGGGYVGGVELTNGSHGKLFVRKQKNGAIITTSAKVDVNINDVNVVAFSINKTSAKIFYNGVFTELTESTTVDTFVNFFPSLLSPANSEFISPNSILTKSIVYNRNLSENEIIDIYNVLK